jgi:hypothetical protein
MALSETDRQILAFEETWWAQPGVKGVAIREQLGISPTQYYARLSVLTESLEALEHAPLLVRRLRRRQTQRRRQRFESGVQPRRTQR